MATRVTATFVATKAELQREYLPTQDDDALKAQVVEFLNRALPTALQGRVVVTVERGVKKNA